MVTRHTFGKTIDTGAVTERIERSQEAIAVGTVTSGEPFAWTYVLGADDIVYGLGETMRGMNKRGFAYTSWCFDQTVQNESTPYMYGAHNFLLVHGKQTFGMFFDTPSRITFDIGWTDPDVLSVAADAESLGVDVYVIFADAGQNPLEQVVRQFRRIIGQSYIPPRWAFGFQQSRWGYRTQEDVRAVVARYKAAHVPLDAVCLDIDYMEEYEDFTVDGAKFPKMREFCAELKADGIRLVPIIDAGVKQKPGYRVYDEGVKNGFFCKKDDGTEYVAGVWPGRSHFTDFFKPEAARWFGDQYRALTDLGIEGFWNDMNEPAMFYSEESLAQAFDKIRTFEGKNLGIDAFFDFTPLSNSTFNREDDYRRFYHDVPCGTTTERIRHDKVHNLYGALMTKAASEGLGRILPDRRVLLYSRASYVGAHRHGGIWTGDCTSWWAHLEQQIKMLPSLNMCGFLYVGSDIGGFGGDASRDLVLRWTQFGVFTPLMRNHSAWNTHEQDCCSFGAADDFRSALQLRYALVPYLYSEFVKASLGGTMLFRPLSFVWPGDPMALRVEDQLVVGDEIMIAPVYQPNATGRYVYLPEAMTQVTWTDGKAREQKVVAGLQYVEMPLKSVVFFVRQGRMVPLCRPAERVDALDPTPVQFLGDGEAYDLYEDDGLTRDVTLAGHERRVVRDSALYMDLS